MSEGYSESPKCEEKWFAVHTYSGYEEKCQKYILQTASAQGLSDQIIDVVIPLEKVEDKRKQLGTDDDGNPVYDTRERKRYPGYIFVKVKVTEEKDDSNYEASQWKMGERAWYIIRNTRGVTGFVGPAGVPYPLTVQECINMSLIDAGADEQETPVIEIPYAEGDLVSINDGYYAGMIGTVASVDIESHKVSVFVNDLGSSITIEVDIYGVGMM